jgi:hypothetical protein
MHTSLRQRAAGTCLILVAAACAGPAPDASDAPVGSAVAMDTLRVAPPTGTPEIDRANVQAAFDSVSAGEAILFAPGTYMLGAGATLTVPDVTVLGHPAGTTLQGCEPEAFDVPDAERLSVVFGCGGLVVRAERQTIRNLTFQYAWHGIVVGPYPASLEEAMAMQTQGLPEPFPVGGQRIEGNTFRATPNGMRVLGVGDEPSVVRDNDFIDTFHAIGIYGPPLHFVENRVSVEDPSRVPNSRHPASAILVEAQTPGTDCSGTRVADNSVEGHPGAIYVLAAPGEVCRGVEIVDNTVRVSAVPVAPVSQGSTVPTTASDTTLVGIPITIGVLDFPMPGAPPELAPGVIEEILVEGNRLLGAPGIGVRVGASNSRIVDNEISDIRVRDPYPGVSWAPDLATWEAGNGSGIWVGPGMNGNTITGNIFERLAGPAITLEGDGNTVELVAPGDSVRDLGRENRITRR